MFLSSTESVCSVQCSSAGGRSRRTEERRWNQSTSIGAGCDFRLEGGNGPAAARPPRPPRPPPHSPLIRRQHRPHVAGGGGLILESRVTCHAMPCHCHAMPCHVRPGAALAAGALGGGGGAREIWPLPRRLTLPGGGPDRTRRGFPVWAPRRRRRRWARRESTPPGRRGGGGVRLRRLPQPRICPNGKGNPGTHVRPVPRASAPRREWAPSRSTRETCFRHVTWGAAAGGLPRAPGPMGCGRVGGAAGHRAPRPARWH